MTMKPLTSADGEPCAQAAEEPGKQAQWREQRGDDAGESRRRPNREIDAGGHDDEAHAEAGQREHRIVAQHAQDVIGAEEMIVAQRAEHDEKDQRDHHPLAAGPGERARPRRSERLRGLGAHALLPRCCDHTAPAMIAPFTTSAAASGTPLASRV